MRNRSDRLVAVATLGAFVVVTGVLGLVSLYLGAVTQALSDVPRSAPLADYPGRPAPAAVVAGVAPVRYLVLVTDDHGDLASAYLAQLSGRRDALQLISLPANLLVSGDGGAETTLSGRFASAHGAGAVESVERLLSTRVDHLIELQLDEFLRLVDVVGGIRVENRAEMSAEGWHFPSGGLQLSAREASVFVGANRQAMTRLERTEAVLVQLVRGVVSGDALTNPAKVETIGTILRGCLSVDAGLTPGEIRRMALDMHLRVENINGTPLPLAGVSELAGAPVTVADESRLGELADAFAADQLDAWADRQGAPWAPLVTLPPR